MIIYGCTHWTIMHCQNVHSNKLWGYFCHDECWYTFWCGVGQAVSFKSHGMYKWDLPTLATKKQKKGYETISLEQLHTLYTNFNIAFSDRFTFVKLMQSVGDA